MSIFRDFFVKQQPLFTGITRGIGGFGFGKTSGGGVSSSGGTSIDVGSDRYHVFIDGGAGTLVTDSPAIIEVMVCGAGGDSSTNPGGYASGGGAGGGGIMYADDATLIAGTHPINVGTPAPAGANGGPSSFTSASGWVLTGLGGGKGSTPQTASPGGSSGGSGYDTAGVNNSTATQPSATSNIPTPYVNYGNKGGGGAVGGYGGCGGGGGAGAVGSAGAQADVSGYHGSGGPGGAGQPFPSFGTTNIGPALPAPTQPHVGTTGLYGGGGGGSCNANADASPNNRSVGGPGGGGTGSRNASGTGTPAVSYGGGAGGNELEGPNAKQTGFQGIVCVKIKNAN